MTKKNYFELLEVSPDASIDEIESAIKNKRTLWMRPQSRADLRAKYDDNRKELPEIEKVMLAASSKVRDDMQAELRSKKEQYVDILKSTLNTMASGGYLLRKDLELIVDSSDAQMAWNIQDVELEAIGLGIDIRDEVPTDETAITPLERIREDQIDRMLIVLQKTDLYDFLEQDNNAPLIRLEAAAKRLLDEARGAIQKTASVNAQTELAGIGLELFSSDRSRKSYDETLRLACSRPIIENARIFAGAEKDLSAQEMHRLAITGKGLGISREETQDLVQSEAKKRENQWTINLAAECPTCGKINPFYLIYCQDAGCVSHLYNIPDDACSDCGKKTPALGEYCVNCGSNLRAGR